MLTLAGLMYLHIFPYESNMRFLNVIGNEIREQRRRADSGPTYSLATIHIATRAPMRSPALNGEFSSTATGDCPHELYFHWNANRSSHRSVPPFFERVANADTFARGYQPAFSDLDWLLKNKRPTLSHKEQAGADGSIVYSKSAEFDKTQAFDYNQNIRNEGVLFSFVSRQPHTASTVGAFHFSEKPRVVVAKSNFSTHYKSPQTSTAIFKARTRRLSIHGVKLMFARTYFQIARPTLHAPDWRSAPSIQTGLSSEGASGTIESASPRASR